MTKAFSLLRQFDFRNLELSNKQTTSHFTMKAFLITILTLFFFSNVISAQEVSNHNNVEFSIDETENVEYSAIFSNTNSLFIDFESLEHLPTNFQVLNEQNEVVFTENLLDLPEDSIYEFDLKSLTKGMYSLQIQTYKNTIQQQFDIN